MDLNVGDNVGIYPLICDGTCSRCVAGHPNICENLGFHGISGTGGGFSEGVKEGVQITAQCDDRA